MNIPERLYLTITSWKKRINNLKPVLESLLNQTITPYKIIVNFCTEDFPNMEEDLPEDLLELIKRNTPMIEVYWFIENYKPWKKHLHTLEIVNPEDLIISTDDDHIYPKDFIEKMYVSYCYYNKKYPVTLNKIMLTHNLWMFNGPATLYWKDCFPKDYKKYLTYNILHNCIDDTFISILFAIAGYMVLPEIFHMPKDQDMLYNDVVPYTDINSRLRTDEDKDRIVVTIDDTLESMNEAIDKIYYKGQPTAFVPSFWGILYDFIEKEKRKNQNPYPVVQYVFDKFYSNFLQGNYPVDFKSLGLDIERTSNKEDLIGKGNKLYVVLSSWNKRINNVKTVLDTIMSNTILPDKIILNLAITDFVNMNGEDDPYLQSSFDNSKQYVSELAGHLRFPKDLADFIVSNDIIDVYWYDRSDYKSWKKYLYVLNYFGNSPCKDSDVIISIDDDIIYKPTFIETLLKSYDYYGRTHPVSMFPSFCQGSFPICGYCLLYTPGFFKDYSRGIYDFKEFITENILHMFPEDNHLLNIFNITNHTPLPAIGLKYLIDDYNFNEGESNFGNLNFTPQWYESYREILDESCKIISDRCSDFEEMKGGWSPVCFNFGVQRLNEFIENNKNTDKEYIKLICDFVRKHLDENPGGDSDSSEIYKKLEYPILDFRK